jgi:hypothetical protein
MDKVQKYNSFNTSRGVRYYEIVYKQGAQKGNADALSRINTVAKEESKFDTVDEKTEAESVQAYHDIFGGHRGMNKTHKANKEKYSWSNMKMEIEDYVKKCEECQVNKLPRPQKKMISMEITNTAGHPFEKCALGIVRPLVES